MSAPSCPQCDDSGLLMLAHGELQRSQAIALRIHVARCAICRARLRRFESLSASLAGAYRNPTLGVRAIGKLPSRRRVWASVGLLMGLLIILGGLVSSHFAPQPTPEPVPFMSASRPMAQTPFRNCPYGGGAGFGPNAPRFGYYHFPGGSPPRPAAGKARL